MSEEVRGGAVVYPSCDKEIILQFVIERLPFATIVLIMSTAVLSNSHPHGKRSLPGRKCVALKLFNQRHKRT